MTRPWSVDEPDTKARPGVLLAYVYFEEEPGRRSADTYSPETNGDAIRLCRARS
jgi:hypothetical protein